jgi:hypothetical protein
MREQCVRCEESGWERRTFLGRMRGIKTNRGVGDSLGSRLKMRRGSEMCLLIRANRVAVNVRS